MLCKVKLFVKVTLKTTTELGGLFLSTPFHSQINTHYMVIAETIQLSNFMPI